MGFLLGSIGLTLIDALCQLINYILELFKAYLNVKICTYNKKVREMHKDDDDDIKPPVIGFHIPSEGDDFEDDEDY